MVEKRWIEKEHDERIASELERSLKIDPILTKLLSQRGINNFDEAKEFFRPSLSQLHDPLLMKDMDKAVEALSLAIEENKNILVYGDYDVDGTSSVALMVNFLSSLSDRVAFYIPDRYKEGYGLSEQGIDFALDNDIDLLITLDCGIKSVELVSKAQHAGLDVIICDHHTPGETLPPALAVLDPKRKDCTYPYKELCGCGVGFKLIQAYYEKQGIEKQGLYEMLDLVALAISADIVPITGENRLLAYFGLKLINHGARIGIQTLLSKKPKNEYTISDLVFTVAPRINAAGRIRSGAYAVELLLSSSIQEAALVAKEIEADNTYRRELDSNISEEALLQLEAQENHLDKRSTVVYRSDWHKGVVGIVASRLIEKYYRPTIVLTRSGDVLAGSARSIRDFDLYNALEACESHLIQFGGHKYAAGMTLYEKDLEALRDSFEAYAQDHIPVEDLIPKVYYDLKVALSSIDTRFYKILRQMAPFGPSNPEPLFLSEGLRDSGKARKVGQDGSHLKLAFDVGKGKDLEAIAFGQGDKIDRIKAGEAFDILFHLAENEWKGNVSLQLVIKELRFAS